ncbi:MAG: polyphosphate kinase [Rhodospirillales bacterium]|nr:polyphosphate kinase [Rhodospirillales bacterium]
MFEAAELGNKVEKTVFNQQVPILRTQLLEVQQKLRRANFPVIIVFAGVDGAGKSETVNLLNEWMDPRWVITRAYTQPSDEEQERPEFWRYWRDLPPKGVIGCFLSSWYSRPVLDHVYGKKTDSQLDMDLDRIISFERGLASDGALILKFWMHLGKEAQKTRFESLEASPLTSWRVTKADWDHWRIYDKFIASAERTIMRTSVGRAPWHIVEGADSRYRSLTVANTILENIERRLRQFEMQQRVAATLKSEPEEKKGKEKKKKPAKKGNGAGNGTPIAASEVGMSAPGISILSKLDMDQDLPRKDYSKRLEMYQGRLNRLSREARDRGMSSILVFEGWDAGGKGGAIRRMTAALDARSYQVIPIAAPTDEEKAHHHLWRFWRHLSRAGRVTIFDRSWYGRVLVERIEGFATEAEWMRGYAELNDFEEQLVEHGIVLLKYWMHITKEEQLSRFKARKKISYKRWKLTDEDWRNREKWDQYELAVNDMIARTSTSIAPWTLVEGDSKRFARIRVISTFCEELEKALDKGRRPTRKAAPSQAKSQAGKTTRPAARKPAAKPAGRPAAKSASGTARKLPAKTTTTKRAPRKAAPTRKT